MCHICQKKFTYSGNLKGHLVCHYRTSLIQQLIGTTQAVKSIVNNPGA